MLMSHWCPGANRRREPRCVGVYASLGRSGDGGHGQQVKCLATSDEFIFFGVLVCHAVVRAWDLVCLLRVFGTLED